MFYGLLVFFGSIIIYIISKGISANFFGITTTVLTLLLILTLLMHVENMSWLRIQKLHKNLIKDIKNNKLDDIDEPSYWDLIKGKF